MERDVRDRKAKPAGPKVKGWNRSSMSTWKCARAALKTKLERDIRGRGSKVQPPDDMVWNGVLMTLIQNPSCHSKTNKALERDNQTMKLGLSGILKSLGRTVLDSETKLNRSNDKGGSRIEDLGIILQTVQRMHGAGCF
jgi:hypothetical protein